MVHRYLQNTNFNFKLKFHLEVGLVEQRYFELFFSAWSIFSSYKRSLLNEPVFTLFYICFNFGHICCTEVIQFFSVENLGHQELKKSSKYELVIFLDEKPRFTFANFLHLFIQGPPLTHSAMMTRVAEVAREHGWHPPKSLDSDENFKPEHTLFCR